jgi:glycosyltransferase involved in cell wall biosynthesis
VTDPLKLLFVADGRSPIALNWIHYFVARGHEVHLASLYPCRPDLALASLTVIPVAFSGAVPDQKSDFSEKSGFSTWKGKALRAIATPALRTWLRQRFVPRSLPKAAAQLQTLIATLRPDLIHAMRVPYEGMLAALALSRVEGLPHDPLPTSHFPLLVSIWGNDFTLHAPATRAMTRLTRFVMQRADALHTDCYRDQPLAQQWGFDPAHPAIVLPGGGGIQLDVFYPPTGRESGSEGSIVVNPRGLRAYVRNDTFFRAIPLVLARHPRTRFVCPTMQGQPEAQKWLQSLGIAESVTLLPHLARAEMADLFRAAQVVVSPSTHDGTPNTLLEALACGCFPVVGDIEPLREWITPGKNGFLVDPADPRALAEAICAGLQNPELRARARAANARLIAERAEYGQVMGAAERFYLTLARAR